MKSFFAISTTWTPALAIAILAVSFSVSAQSPTGISHQKNRMIVLTDIEADPDDTQSLARLLLYANQIDVKGIVATTSSWQKKRIAQESIEKAIRAYGQVQPNLVKHENGFPSAEALLSLVKKGLPVYGMEELGREKIQKAKEETIHFILRVTDKGARSLSRYKRVIVTVQPK